MPRKNTSLRLRVSHAPKKYCLSLNTKRTTKEPRDAKSVNCVSVCMPILHKHLRRLFLGLNLADNLAITIIL